ncbi:MAG TPA: glycosyltransferase family 4 protein [Gaiellaceae bacterium]|nr:glycosyltransferase family 4 protein [Gaiellaceae bacterium]
MKLVFITQELGPGHPVLAQTVDLVRGLSSRVDELAVVARDVEWEDIPANVSMRTFEATGKIRRGLAFERSLAAALPGADAVFVHMVPEFAVLAAPLARVRRLPILFWYTHWNVSRQLRIAARLATVVLSVDTSSFPIATPKVRGIGHAIDVERFAAAPPAEHAGPLRLLAFGRTARWKGLATLLDAVSLARGEGADVRLEIRGPSLTDDEQTHRLELERHILSDPMLQSHAELLAPVAREEMPTLLAASDIVISPNEPRSGSTLDKAVFEAAACARPVISTNTSFAPLLGGLPLPLLAAPRDAAALAAAIATVAAAASAVRTETGSLLRERVIARHSLDHWADAVLDVVGEVRSPRGTASSARAAG